MINARLRVRVEPFGRARDRFEVPLLEHSPPFGSDLAQFAQALLPQPPPLVIAPRGPFPAARLFGTSDSQSAISQRFTMSL